MFFRITILLCVFNLSLLSLPATADNVASSINDIDISNKAGLALNSRDFYFRINGRLMVDYSVWQGASYSGHPDKSGAGSEIRRSRIYLKGKYKDWQYYFQTNFNKNGASNGNTYIKYSGFNYFDVFIGKHAEPFGLEASNSSKYIAAIERTVTGNSHFAGDRELGISIAGHKQNYAYQLGVFDVDSTENDINYTVTGRFTYLPLQQENQLLHLGVGISKRNLNERSLFEAKDRAGVHATDIKSITTGQFQAESSFVYNLELSYDAKKLNVTAEYQHADVSEFGNANNRAFSSYYVQASYFLTQDLRPYDVASGTFLAVTPNSTSGAWEIFARHESVDFSSHNYGSNARIFTAGVNYFATKLTRLSIDYIHSEIDYAKMTNLGRSIDGDAVTFRAQFYW